jgi:triphosphoribosyl-dephospho-CoA synthase
VLEAVEATRQLAGTNTNLGIILLLAPLTRVPRDEPLAGGVRRVLNEMTPADARDVYQAIRAANPGGLNPSGQTVGRDDVQGPAPTDLRQAMSAAADRDLIARQYDNGFCQVLDVVLPWLLDSASGDRLTDRIILAHVRLMSEYPDSLIARKCGQIVANESAARAAAVLQLRSGGPEAYHRALADLDFWLRSDGNRRNPGTSADLLAGGLFAALRDGHLRPPWG